MAVHRIVSRASSRFVSRGVAGAVVLMSMSLTSPATAGAVTAGEPVLAASPGSGPVGTVVHLSGNAGAGCQHGTSVSFGYDNGPIDVVNVATAPNGSWQATFVVPSFVGAIATRGGYGSDVFPGPWEFQAAPCSGGPGSLVIVPFLVTTTTVSPSRFVGIAATPGGHGYWLVQAGGGVYSFGDARFHGSLPGLHVAPAAPISGIAATPDGGGYWLVGQDGGVFAFGDVRYYGSLPAKGIHPFGVVVGVTPTSDGGGYWLLGADGGVFAFGDAGFFGAPRAGPAEASLLRTPGGKGYMVINQQEGRPTFEGDSVSSPLASSIPSELPPHDAMFASAALTPSGNGLWEAGTDGGVFSYGDARYLGSLPGLGIAPAAPVVGMAAAADGGGYWLLGADGGVFAFGNAGFYGSAG